MCSQNDRWVFSRKELSFPWTLYQRTIIINKTLNMTLSDTSSCLRRWVNAQCFEKKTPLWLFVWVVIDIIGLKQVCLRVERGISVPKNQHRECACTCMCVCVCFKACRTLFTHLQGHTPFALNVPCKNNIHNTNTKTETHFLRCLKKIQLRISGGIYF